MPTSSPERTNALPTWRRLPIGVELAPQGGAHARVWAPSARAVTLVRYGDDGAEQGTTPLEPDDDGYFAGHDPNAGPGTLYRFRLDDRGPFPDPASRFQPQGPHGPSQIVDPRAFHWTDDGWRGVRLERQVLYELHVGTFTAAGTFAAAAERLPDLVDVGITTIEIMPLADFAGEFGWGYDGVNLFAPTRLYGSPDDVRAFVDAAHALGLGVILDVVYNHFGPDGNYLREYGESWFKGATEWGDAINFDGEDSAPVREYFRANAAYWIDEFHFDGLRLDATQQIFDKSPSNIIGEVAASARAAAAGRDIIVVAENEPQRVELLRDAAQGGCGLDGLWNDDFHHAAEVALTGRSEAYYSGYEGKAREFVAAAKHGFLYQGQYYTWQKQRRGTPTIGVAPERFITYLENHDQVANGRGERLCRSTSPGRWRAMSTLLLLAPQTPMLFQGQEFGSSRPFYYFADHNDELARAVRKGRAKFLSQFPSLGTPEGSARIPDPGDRDTFERCRLDWRERDENASISALYRDLIALRLRDPVLSSVEPFTIDGMAFGDDALVLRWFDGAMGDRLLLVNLGRLVPLDRAAEPLLAPPEGSRWKVAWSSEDPRYGGWGTPTPDPDGGGWAILPEAALLLMPEAR